MQTTLVKRIAGLVAIGVAAASTIATQPDRRNSGSGLGADGGLPTTATFGFQSASALQSVRVSPDAPVQVLTGTLQISESFTSAVTRFVSQEASIVIDLHGVGLTANQTVVTELRVSPPHAVADGETDAGIPVEGEDAVATEVLPIGTDGAWKRSFLSVAPDWSRGCVRGQACAARFQVTVTSSVNAGGISGQSQMGWSVDAVFPVIAIEPLPRISIQYDEQ